MKEFIVRDAIDQMGAVATLPSVALQVMRIAEDPDASEDALHAALMGDPALAARVLKVVNSAFYRRQREVASPRAAIRLLGMSAVRNIALAASMHRLFRGGRAIPGFDPAAVWLHSLAVGVAAHRVALLARVLEPEEAMLAGLLHDIGLIVQMQARAASFTHVVATAQAEPERTFRSIEQELMGATHEDFGGALCDRWNFPLPIVHVCGYHHDPRALPVRQQLLPAVVHVADALAARSGQGYIRTVETQEPLPEVLALLRLDPPMLDALVDPLREDIDVAMATLAG